LLSDHQADAPAKTCWQLTSEPGEQTALNNTLDAVTVGLTLPWGPGVAEGHVNRVKALKRTMSGRASFELLPCPNVPVAGQG
jgi:hypothetical protein